MRLVSAFFAMLALSPAAFAGSKSSSTPAPSVDDPLPAHETASAAPAKPARTQLPDAAILPATGDIGIGFDLAPTLTYLGSFLSQAGGNGSGLAAYPQGFDQMLYVKYYISPTLAARARVGLTFDDQTVASYEPDPVVSADPKKGPDKAEEIKNTVSTNNVKFIVGGGAEMRRGYRRLQGYLGGEGIIGFFSTSSKSTYGWDYSKEAQDNGVIGDGSERELSSSSGLGFVLGARGFVGIEYFFVRKISIAAEYGYGLSVLTSGRGSQVVETWTVNDSGKGSGGTKTNSGDGSGSRIRADVDNGIDQLYSGGTGSVSVLFHF